MQFGNDVKPGKLGELQQWLAANEKEYANSLPMGVDYLGTYSSIFDTDRDRGQVHTFLRLDSYAAQDRLAEATRGDAHLGKLQRELVAFFEVDGPNFSSGLYKAVVDATLYV